MLLMIMRLLIGVENLSLYAKGAHFKSPWYRDQSDIITGHLKGMADIIYQCCPLYHSGLLMVIVESLCWTKANDIRTGTILFGLIDPFMVCNLNL